MTLLSETLRQFWEQDVQMVLTDYRVTNMIYRRELDVNYKTQLYLTNLLSRTTGSILDVGCGIFPGTYLPQGKDYIYVDFVRNVFLDHQSKNVQADAGQLPFPKNTFSAVISKQLYGYLPKPHKLLVDMYNLLKPNGIFSLIDIEGNLCGYESRIFNFDVQKLRHQLKDLGLVKITYATLTPTVFLEIPGRGKIKACLKAISGIKAPFK